MQLFWSIKKPPWINIVRFVYLILFYATKAKLFQDVVTYYAIIFNLYRDKGWPGLIGSPDIHIHLLPDFWLLFLCSGIYYRVSPLYCCNGCCCISNCSNSSALRSRNAALSRYPVTSWRTALISVGFSLCVSRGSLAGVAEKMGLTVVVVVDLMLVSNCWSIVGLLAFIERSVGTEGEKGQINLLSSY